MTQRNPADPPSSPLVSVIVVNHNGRRFLERCFSSLQTQTHSRCELIFVDTESTDDSVAFMRATFPAVTIVETPNRGFGAACNAGARRAQGTYAAFVNEDMYFPQEYVADLLKEYQRLRRNDPEIGALATSEYAYDRRPHAYFPETLPGNIDPFGFPVVNRHKSRAGAIIPGCPFFMERALFLECGGFCENIFLYGDDTDLSWRLTLFGKHNYSAPQLHLFHYEGGSLKGYPPRKVTYILASTLMTIFNNYSFPFLLVFLPLSLFFILVFVTVGLLVMSRGNIAYGLAPLRAVLAFFRAMPRSAPFRAFVQRRRRISDVTFIRRHMTPIPGLLASRAYRKLG